MPNPHPEQLKFKLPGGKIAALAWGAKTGYPILALHGWLDNAASFTPIAPFLAQHNLRIIAIDFPGHGLSEHKPKGTYVYISDYIADVALLIDQLNVPAIALLGHSLGGAVASLVTGVAPKKISHLLLLDSLGPLAIKPDHSVELMSRAIEQYKHLPTKRLPSYASIEAAVQARMRATPMTEPAVRILLARGLKHIVATNSYCWRTDPRLLLKPLMMLLESQVENFLSKIKVPTCIIRPTSGWPFSEEHFAEHCKHIADLVVYKLSGHHHVHMDAPDAVAQLICGFLQTCNNPIINTIKDTSRQTTALL